MRVCDNVLHVDLKCLDPDSVFKDQLKKMFRKEPKNIRVVNTDKDIKEKYKKIKQTVGQLKKLGSYKPLKELLK